MRNQIRGHVEKHFYIKDLTDSTPLFTSGRIDSFGVLELIAYLEEEFGVQIDTAKHQLTQFDTVEKIEELVVSLKKPK